MDWRPEFIPGNTRAACSICGCSRRFPDNLTFCADQLYRCERCMEVTPLERDQKVQAYRQHSEEPDSTGMGLPRPVGGV
jgi:hypothetical protein